MKMQLYSALRTFGVGTVAVAAVTLASAAASCKSQEPSVTTLGAILDGNANQGLVRVVDAQLVGCSERKFVEKKFPECFIGVVGENGTIRGIFVDLRPESSGASTFLKRVRSYNVTVTIEGTLDGNRMLADKVVVVGEEYNVKR